MNTRLEGYTVEYINREEYLRIKKEIFTSEIYNLELQNSPIIIDAGAHIGLATLYFKKKYPQSRIITVEPNPILFKTLELNIEQNSISGITLINKALAKKEGKMDFFIDNAGTWYSTGGKHVGAWSGNQQSKKIEVETITLSSLLKEPIDLLKLDIEGSELEVLKESKEKLGLVRNIVLEFHSNRDNKLEKLLKLLNSSGYTTKVIGTEQNLSLVYATRQA
jgi:FkbM family methyltransferase